MNFNVHNICPDYDFVITGASYIGKPTDHTAMFISAKVGNLLANIVGVKHCLIFAESGMEVPEALKKENCFIFSEKPQRDYALFMDRFAKAIEQKDMSRKYRLTNDGYYLGENVSIGSGAYIEPSCVIGHDVRIGDHARIHAGCVIKNAVIGDYFLANENAVIGSNGFTFTEDQDGNKFRIPTLGKVLIGNHVEVGPHGNISSGSAGNTVIEDYVKLATQVQIGHDVHIGKNTEITAGVIVAGFDDIGRESYIGINATLRNRIVLGERSRVSMGAVVTQNVPTGCTVTGNFAVEHNRFLTELKEANLMATEREKNTIEPVIPSTPQDDGGGGIVLLSFHCIAGRRQHNGRLLCA